MRSEGRRRRSSGHRITVCSVIVAVLLLSCKNDQSTEPQGDQSNSLKLLSFLETTYVIPSDTLTFCWEAKLSSSSDSIVVQIEDASHQQGRVRLAVHPAADGCIKIVPIEIESDEFRLHLVTQETRTSCYSGYVKVRDTRIGIAITSPECDIGIYENSSLRFSWESWGLEKTEKLLIAARSATTKTWIELLSVGGDVRMVDIPTSDLPGRSSWLRVRATQSGVEAISPGIHVVSDSTRLTILSPSAGDTVIYHIDAIRFVRSPVAQNDKSLEMAYAKNPITPRTGSWYDAQSGSIEIANLFEPPSSKSYWKYYFYLRIPSEQIWHAIEPVYVCDYQIRTVLAGQTLRRGTLLEISKAHLSFIEPDFSADPSRLEKHAVFAISTDEGKTWIEERAFYQERMSLLLTAQSAENCYLRMRSERGTRVFEDIAGPFTIVDEITPMFEWKVGDQLRYRLYKTHGHILDTLTLTVVSIEEYAERINYECTEYSARSGITRNVQITEDKSAMHLIKGWIFPRANIHRYADANLDSYQTSWNEGPSFLQITVDVVRGKGITATHIYDRTTGEIKQEHLTLLP